MFQGIIRELHEGDLRALENIFELYWPDVKFREHLIARLKGFVACAPDVIAQGFRYFIAEDAGRGLGVVGFRMAPPPMQGYMHTQSPAELYILATRARGVGVGRALVTEALIEMKDL